MEDVATATATATATAAAAAEGGTMQQPGHSVNGKKVGRPSGSVKGRARDLTRTE